MVMIMEIIVSVLLLFVGIAVLVTIHLCIVGRAFRRSYGSGSIMILSGGNRSTSMSREDLKKLPCFDYKDGADPKENGGRNGVDCAVCLESLKGGDRCRLLPNCKHTFHTQCIDLWLLKTPICPICRTCAKSSKIDSVLPEQSSGSREDEIELA